MINITRQHDFLYGSSGCLLHFSPMFQTHSIISKRTFHTKQKKIIVKYVSNSMEYSLFQYLIVAELLKKFLTFYGKRRSITEFTRTCHLILFSTSVIQPTPSFSFFGIYFDIILPCPGMCPPHIPLYNSTEVFCIFLIFSMPATCVPIRFLIGHWNNI